MSTKKINLFLKISVIFSLALFLFPLLSLADITVPLTNKNDTFTQVGPQQFLYNTCSAATPGTIDLNWKLPSTVFKDKHNYVCTALCRRCATIDKAGNCLRAPFDTDPHSLECNFPPEVIKACSTSQDPDCGHKAGESAGDSFVRKNDDKVARFDYPDGSWNIHKPLTTKVAEALNKYDHNVVNLELKEDKVTIPNVIPGNSYRISCAGPAASNSSGLATTPWVTVGSNCPATTPTTTPTGGSCEVPFSEIADAYQKQIPVHVTEKSFKDWVVTDDADYVRWALNDINDGQGSGDLRDAKNIMNINQICATNDYYSYAKCDNPQNLYYNQKFQYLNSPIAADKTAEEIFSLVESGYPVELNFRGDGISTPLPVRWTVNLYPPPEGLQPDSHAVTIVGVSKNEINPGYYVYNYQVLDPNVPERITEINGCQSGKMTIHYSGKDYVYEGLVCNSESYGPVITYQFESGLADGKAKAMKYADFCLNSSNKKSYPDLCSRNTYPNKITNWIKSNLISLSNPSGAGGGACWAWTQFVLNSAYFADFVGYDFHADDGYVVGTGCNADYQPYSFVKTKVSQKDNWMAAIINSDLLGQINKFWPF